MVSSCTSNSTTIIYYCGCGFNSVKKDDQDAWDDYYYIKADGYYISMVH